MWTAPVPQELSTSDRIACIHMSGLLMRSGYDRWPRWFPQREFQTDWRPCSATGSHGLPRISDRSIPTICSLLQLRLRTDGEPRRCADPADLFTRLLPMANVPRDNFRPSPAASRRYEPFYWRVLPPRASATCAPAARGAKAMAGRDRVSPAGSRPALPPP